MDGLKKTESWGAVRVRKTTRGHLKLRAWRRTVYVWDKQRDHVLRVTLLVSENLDGTERKYTLTNAPQKGYKDVIEALLTSKAEVNARNSMGQTPLHMAALAGDNSVLQLLLASKAKVNAKDKSGSTPLHCAALGDEKDVAESLLGSGAEVNAKNDKGATPLHWAVEEENEQVAAVLRQHGGHE